MRNETPQETNSVIHQFSEGANDLRQRLGRLLASGHADPAQSADFSRNLTSLRDASLVSMALFSGGLGYLWIVLIMWPAPGVPNTPASWAGSLALVVSASIALLVKGRLPYLAGQILLWGSVASITFALTLYSVSQAAYLFIVPITFANVIHGRWTVFLIAGAGISMTWGLHMMRDSDSAFAALQTIAIIALTAVAAWLSARNLYTALTWVWSGYERARRNEELARDRQAELSRVLKALDEAVYRIERANHMLTQARLQAETAVRLKQQFAQTVSHELRMPLNMILSFVELMIQSPEYYGGPMPARYLRDLAIVHRNARHLQTLVNDVLDMARIQAAQMGLAAEETDPDALVREVAAMAHSLIESRGLSLTVEAQPDLPTLWLDPVRIRQVLLNLLNNAARFTEVGGVTVGVRADDVNVIFSVADTGVGIAAEDLPRVFKEFEQLDGGTRRGHGGTGLGLAISRAFVELHGGQMWVESEVGAGSRFSFSLPVARATPLSLGGDATALPIVASIKQSDQPILLAVTSSPSAATLLTRYVRGYRAVIVGDLAQASRSVPQLAPEGVVIDSATVALSPESIEEMARSWGFPDMPVIVTPLPGEDRLRQQLAVEGYLIKPITPDALWDMLRQFGERIARILIVDDDRDFVRLLTRMLEGSTLRPYQVDSAFTGQEAIDQIHLLRPDLILLDLNLTDMNGQDVIQAVRAMPEGHAIPILVISARDDIEPRDALPGTMLITKANGLTTADIVHWTQRVLDGGERGGAAA